ncbi:VOC family protein [Roseobacteraceae bacterium NS-SX3]
MELDHIAVAGTTLDEAAAYVEDALGVPLQDGGKHEVFGTHNRLLALAEGLYLEAIAIDPEATPERAPRWFDLDRFEGAPRLSNWICRATGLAEALERMPDGAGEPVALTRGSFSWQMAVPLDGVLPFDNMFPALIEWNSDHPAERLTPQGCALRRLVVAHPDAADLEALLPLHDGRVIFETGKAGFEAEFDTPHGIRVLR